jgi:hypothetical protein
LRRLLRRRGVGQALAQRIGLCWRVPNLARPISALPRRWRQPAERGRFAEHRLEELTDAPSSRAPRSIGDDAVERLVALTLEEAPRDATHWSTRAMAHRAGISQTPVSRMWRAFGQRPQRKETFKLSSDPAFVERVRKAVGLYLAPPNRALVLCVDEEPQIQAAQGTAPASPCGQVRPNDAPMTTTAIARSTSSAVGAFTSTADLKAAIHAYIAEANAEPKAFVWTKAADDILASIARLCLRTSNSIV